MRAVGGRAAAPDPFTPTLSGVQSRPLRASRPIRSRAPLIPSTPSPLSQPTPLAPLSIPSLHASPHSFPLAPFLHASLPLQVDTQGCCLVVTTGGTGPAPRDVTPEATEAVCSRMMPGYGEQMRAISLKWVRRGGAGRAGAAGRGGAGGGRGGRGRKSSPGQLRCRTLRAG